MEAEPKRGNGGKKKQGGEGNGEDEGGNLAVQKKKQTGQKKSWENPPEPSTGKKKKKIKRQEEFLHSGQGGGDRVTGRLEKEKKLVNWERPPLTAQKLVTQFPWTLLTTVKTKPHKRTGGGK